MSRIYLLFNRFSAKIILAFLLVILIPTLFTSVFFYFASDSILKKNVRESTVQIAKKTADSLSSILNVGSDTSDFIYSDLNIQHAVLHVNSSNSEEQSRMFQYMNTMLNNIVYSNSFVKIVYVLKEDGNGWGSGTFSDRKVKRMQLSSQSWVKEANSKNGEFVWQGIQYDARY
jgi:two-component system sensor histidine kinase YesM